MKALLAAALAAGLGCAGSRPPAPAPPAAPRPGPSDAEVAMVANPHDLGGKPFCAGCHQREGARELRAAPLALCRRCHSFAHGNHPVDVVQTRPAGGLPLMPGNRVACHSCHDPHDLKRHARGLRLEFNALCVSCHTTGGRAHH